MQGGQKIAYTLKLILMMEKLHSWIWLKAPKQQQLLGIPFHPLPVPPYFTPPTPPVSLCSIALHQRCWRKQHPLHIMKYDKLEVSASLYETQVPGSMSHRFPDCYSTKVFGGVVKRTRENVNGQRIAGMHVNGKNKHTQKT